MSLDRRVFLKGTGVAAGLAAVGGIGGVACASEDAGAGTSPDASGGSVAIPVSHQVIDTDILVIGAGVAGVEAAISGRKAGASVVIVDKKEFNHCGNSGMHDGAQMTSPGFEINGDGVEMQAADAISQSAYMLDQDFAREIAQAYYDDIPPLKDENYGSMHYRDPETGVPYITNSSNAPRCWAGYRLQNHGYMAISLGCRILDYHTVTCLLVGESGEVAGACAIDFKTGNFVVIRAKATILATGGDGGLWGAGTVCAIHGGGIETLTGDGHAWAASLGVRFRDLEFRSLSGWCNVLYPTSLAGSLGLWAYDYANFKDSNGDPIFDLSDGHSPSTREVTVAWYRTVTEGRAAPHGGMYAPLMDFVEGTTFSQLGISNNVCEAGRAWVNDGYDLYDNTIVEAGQTHCYDYGGMITDINGFTGVDGLYAAGECAMHSGAGYGAFRMYSSGMILGKRAAEAAGQRALEIPEGPSLDWDAVSAEYSRVMGILYAEPDNPIRVHELKHRIQDSCWKGAGALVSEKQCQEALAELEAEEADLQNVYCADKSPVCNLEWMEALSLGNMIKLGRMDTLAGMTRTESRGTHFRAEYPEQDNDNWIKHVILQEVDGEVQVSLEDVVIDGYEPEPGKVDLGGGVLEGF